jgi:dephospho-CoA kinase
MTIFVGLTGGISCGKSTVSSILERNGCIIIDFDKIAKKALQPGETPYNSTVEYFQNQYKDLNGNSVNILEEDGKTINRDKLGSIVFADKEARKTLQSFTDQWCFWNISKEIYSHWSFFSNDKIVILDAPLLFETKGIIVNFHSGSVWTCHPL